jgi:hypothetical protein
VEERVALIVVGPPEMKAVESKLFCLDIGGDITYHNSQF